MIAAFGAATVRAAEAAHGLELISGALMDRAATGLARQVVFVLQELRGQVRGAQVTIAVGSGNNGGDALIAGAKLAQRGVAVTAVCVGASVHEAGLAALRRANGRVLQWNAADSMVTQQEPFLDVDIIIDGIVGTGGTGGTGALRPAAAAVVELINASGALIVAVDLPSGVNADTGAVAGAAIAADVTVTFGCLKPGLLIAPGSGLAGAIHTVDIGITDALDEPALIALEALEVVAFVPEPNIDDFKYRRGVVGVAAGSWQYPGAALLCVGAARLGGVGMVRYLDQGDQVAQLVVAAYPDVVASGADPSASARVTAWACGPGFVPEERVAIDALLRTEVPVVLDAGALMAVANSVPLRKQLAGRSGISVITPHTGEAAALAAALSLPADLCRLELAKSLAVRLGLVVVLKGPGTLIAAPSGLVLVDTMGGAELSTAGSGDVLTGLAAALLAGASARGEIDNLDDAAAAVAAAVWLHGQAGQLAAATGRPVTAVDVLDHLSGAVAQVRR